MNEKLMHRQILIFIILQTCLPRCISGGNEHNESIDSEASVGTTTVINVVISKSNNSHTNETTNEILSSSTYAIASSLHENVSKWTSIEEILITNATVSSPPSISATTTVKSLQILSSNASSPIGLTIAKHRSFDFLSFIGGMVLTLGLIAIFYIVHKFFASRTYHTERSYHTL